LEKEATAWCTFLIGCVVVMCIHLGLPMHVDRRLWGEITRYAAKWRGTDVAVKILRGSLSHAQLESAAAEIIRELNTMRRVGNHRHIVSLLGICHLQFPARLAIVTDFMHRGSLLDVLKGKTGEPPAHVDVVRIAAEVAAGISHLHREGVVHRDLAARNVLVDKHYSARVGDFGYACADARLGGVGSVHCGGGSRVS